MKSKKDQSSRRRFLKTSLTGIAGISILPSLPGSSRGAEAEEKKEYKIVKRPLGRTGLVLPVVTMGAGRAETPELIAAALDMGIMNLDTANSYGNGRNEELIGSVIKGRPRDSYVITTKATGPEDRRTGQFRKEATTEMFIEKFETSLQRLGVDYVDILLIHSVATKEATVYEPFMTAVERMKKEGKTRFIGVSTHANEPEVIRAATESKVHDVVLTAYNFRQPHAAELEAAMEEAAKAGLGIIAMKTQAGVYWDRERQNKINMKAALKWALRKEYVHTAIPGIANMEQLHENFSVMEDLALSAEEKKDLQLGMRSGFDGLYCRQCGKCVDQCAAGMDIPTMMRSYMYLYGYRDLALAKETMSDVELPNLPCDGCHACKVRCTMGFDVRDRLVDITRLRDVPEEFVV
jgi:aryl-alcohol dehydrogenase-like predicted oxidoreductase